MVLKKFMAFPFDDMELAGDHGRITLEKQWLHYNGSAMGFNTKKQAICKHFIHSTAQHPKRGYSAPLEGKRKTGHRPPSRCP